MNACTPHGRTALHIASAQGHGHIVDLLLEKGEKRARVVAQGLLWGVGEKMA